MNEQPMPVRPRNRTALAPLGLDQVHIGPGFWSEWQRANREVSIPHGLRWIERDGVLDAFRRVAGQEARSGSPVELYADSDLYKMLEAIGWDQAVAPDEGAERIVAELAALLRAAQAEDGYLNTVVQSGRAVRFGNLVSGHELYCAGHLIQAAIAVARSTNDESGLLEIAVDLADLLVRVFLDGRRCEPEGHPEIEMSLVELYRQTGDERYLQLARQFIDARGHGLLGSGPFGPAQFLDDLPVRDRHEIAGHAVRAFYLMAGMVDVSLETGDQSLLEAAERQWETAVAEKGYLTGAFGARFEGEQFGDPFELPPDLAYGETCASIGALMASWRLLLATGRSRYADLIERILYNVLAASTSLERDAFFYVNPLHRRRPRPAAPADGKPVGADAPGTRAAWYDSACCPPNVMRTIAALGGYVATRSERGLQIHQFLPGGIDTTLGSERLRLESATSYPEEGSLRIEIQESPAAPWELAIRSPGWAEGVRVRVNGVEAGADGLDGYLRIERVWRAGDRVEVEIPLRPRLTQAHPAADAMRGSVAVERGPVVYCLESLADEGHETGALDAVLLDPSGPLTLDAPLEGTGLPTIVAVGGTRDDSAWRGIGWAPLGSVGAASPRPHELRLIPYSMWANRGSSTMRVWIPLLGTIDNFVGS